MKYKTKKNLQLEYTLQEVGDILGCSAQAVEHVERRALAKVERMLKERFGDSIKLTDLIPEIRTEALS